MHDNELQRWAHERVQELPGATLDHPFGPEHDVYRVQGKVFMLQSSLRGAPLVTLKSRPADAEVLRAACPEIIPGYHMNKRHWITLLDPAPGSESGTKAGLGRQLVEDLVTESYLLIVEQLPRALRPVNPSTFGQA